MHHSGVLCRLSVTADSILQEVEQQLSNTYHTKPLLYGEVKSRGQPGGILDSFEQDRRQAKDSSDRYVSYLLLISIFKMFL